MSSWIDSSDALAEFCGTLPPGKAVALDTEFDWQRTYYPRFALLQIGVDRETAAIVDPFKIDDWSPLAELLNDATRRKILFSGANDLPILVRACGGPERCLPVNTFDVQTAYLFLGKEQTPALKSVIAEELGIELEKSETRSDWTIRPLTPAQLQYATDDVVLLPELADIVEQRLKTAGNYEFFCEEMLLDSQPEAYSEIPCEDAFRKVAGYWEIERADVRARLRGLAYWRENLARSRDIARNRIFKDMQLVWMAYHVPFSPAGLAAMPEKRSSNLEHYAQEAIAAMKIRIPEPETSYQPLPPQFKSDLKTLTRRILGLVQKRAAERSIAPGLIANRRDVEGVASALLRKRQPSSHCKMLAGWRRTLLDPGLSEILAETH